MAESYERQARDILERCGWEEAQRTTAGDVVEVANLLVKADQLQLRLDRVRLWAIDESLPGLERMDETAHRGYRNAQKAALVLLILG